MSQRGGRLELRKPALSEGLSLAATLLIQTPDSHAMIWFLERDSDLLMCEIRPVADRSARAYEFEIAPANGPAQTLRFENPTELIDAYLREQASLRAKGWRPRTGPVEQLD